MPIDTSIAMGFKQPDFGSPVNNLAQMLQMQGLQQGNQLNKLKIDEYQQGVERSNALRGILSGDFAKPEDRQSAMIKGGFLKEANDYAKGNADVAKSATEAKVKELEAANKRIDLAGSVFGYVRQNPTAENAFAALDHLGANGVYTPEQVSEYKAKIQANPQAVANMADLAFRGALSAKEQLAKLGDFNAGGSQQFTSTDPVTGQVTKTGSMAITESENNKANNATSRANNAATVGATYANAAATREVAKSNVEAARIQTGFNNEQGLRKEFEGLPEVKNYKQAYPAFAAIKDATGRNTTQSDINIVYGLAKLYDPTSVVREGEYATVANSPNIPEKVKGYAQYLAGGGRLSPETKKQILAEAQGRIGTYEAEAKKAKTSYEGIAKKRGMEPSSVFAGMGDMVESGAAPAKGGFKYLGTE